MNRETIIVIYISTYETNNAIQKIDKIFPPYHLCYPLILISLRSGYSYFFRLNKNLYTFIGYLLSEARDDYQSIIN